MPSPSLPDGFGEVVLHWSSPDADGSSPVMTFGVEVVADWNDAAVHDLYDAIVSAGVLTNVQNTWALEQVSILWNDGGTLKTAEWTEHTAGGEAGVAAPAQVAALIRKNTGLAGRKFRGRMYQPGLAAGDIAADGTINATVRAQLQGAWDDVLALFDGVTFPMSPAMVVIHEDLMLTPTPVISLGVESSAATQRRRARK